MMKMNQETGCCSTRVRTFVIAILCIFGCVSSISACIFILGLIAQGDDVGQAGVNNNSSINDNGLVEFRNYLVGDNETGVLWATIIIIFFVCLNLGLSNHMLIGVVQNQPKKVLPWLYYNYVWMILEFILLFLSVITVEIHGVLILGSHLMVYVFMVFLVHSYADTATIDTRDDGAVYNRGRRGRF